MKRISILVLCLASWFITYSQSPQTAATLPYFYEEFREGQVFFTEGNPVRAILNYSFILQEMQFLNHQSNNQVLTMVRKPNMTHIEIGKDIFVPVDDMGWAVVIQDGPVTLLEKRQFIPDHKTGAYGVALTTSGAQHVSSEALATMTTSATTSTSITPSGMSVTTVSGVSVDAGGIGGGRNPHREFDAHGYKVDAKFYLMKDRRIHAATRRNFLRVYASVRPQLETFIRENRVNFNNEEHLRGLTRYANSLLLAR
jgi:hypothetical protein